MAFRLAGIPVASLANGEVLHIHAVLVLVDEEHRRLVLVLRDRAGIVHKEHTLHTFADEGGVLHDFGECCGAEVVGAIEEEDTITPFEVAALGCCIEGNEKFVDGTDGGIVGRTVLENLVVSAVCLEVGKEIGIRVYGVFKGRFLADEDFVLIGPSHEVVAFVGRGCKGYDSAFAIETTCWSEGYSATFGRKGFGTDTKLFCRRTATPVATDGDLIEAHLLGVSEAIDVDAEGKGV